MTLELSNVTAERHAQQLFYPVSFHLNSGESLQICGANGCGKSTLLRIIAGYLEPHTGHVTWHQNSIMQSELSYIGHHHGNKMRLTAQENLHLSAALAGKKIQPSQIKSSLERMGLDPTNRAPIMTFSAGQLRRLALARLLLNPTTLWILDEPTTSLDSAGQQLVQDLLDAHLKNGGIAVIVAHQSHVCRDANILQLDSKHHA